MKKILIIFALFLTLSLNSCVNTCRGNFGVVQEVELMHGYNGSEPEYKYKVTVYHENDACNKYKILTNELYHPGDTIKIGLKR